MRHQKSKQRGRGRREKTPRCCCFPKWLQHGVRLHLSAMSVYCCRLCDMNSDYTVYFGFSAKWGARRTASTDPLKCIASKSVPLVWGIHLLMGQWLPITRFWCVHGVNSFLTFFWLFLYSLFLFSVASTKMVNKLKWHNVKRICMKYKCCIR